MEDEAVQVKAGTQSTTMQAAVFEGKRQVALREVDAHVPALDEVRVRLEGCGVCASNVPLWEGRPWFDYPQEPGAGGHEGWGYVEAVGSAVDDVAVGDRVTMLSHHAYAEYDTIGADKVVVLPAELGEQPFPGEPLGCAMNVFRRSDIRAGQTVAIVGIGFLGALLTGLATAAGARVFACSRRPFALEMAQAFGAEETARLEEDSQAAALEQAEAWTDGDGCDRVIEATGKQDPLHLAGKLTRVRGRLIIAGYHQDGLREVNMQLWNWRGLDVINAHERNPRRYLQGMREAVTAVAEGRIDPTPLYTHDFSINQLEDAFCTITERPRGFMKALITFE